MATFHMQNSQPQVAKSYQTSWNKETACMEKCYWVGLSRNYFHVSSILSINRAYIVSPAFVTCYISHKYDSQSPIFTNIAFLVMQ